MFSLFKSSEKVPEIVSEKNCVYAPVSGKVIQLNAVSDGMFAKELLGKGIAIEPNSDVIYAPISGKITAAPKSCHAVAMTSPDGVEVLIHIGFNTVELKGQYFKTSISKGDEVKAGQKLIEFNRAKIRKAGYDITIPVVITNSDDYTDVSTVTDKDVTVLEKVIQVKQQ